MGSICETRRCGAGLRFLPLALPLLALPMLAVAGAAVAGDIVIQPNGLAWQTDDPDDPENPFSQQTPDRGFDGSGLDDASLVDNGDPIPTAWPLHTPWGNGSLPPVADVATRVLKAGAPGPVTRTLTLDFDATYEVDGVALWNWSSYFINPNTLVGASDNNRGINFASVEVSTDGGATFTALDLDGNSTVDELDLLTFTEIAANTGNSTPAEAPLYAPEVVSLGGAFEANAIRLTATNFGAGSMMGIGEIRFTGFAIESGLDGDYNDDGTVNLADYTIWRDNLGAADETSLMGNGDGLNGVDAGDYTLWKTSFGGTGGAAAGALLGATAVPEPSAVLLLGAAACCCSLARRRQQSAR